MSSALSRPTILLLLVTLIVPAVVGSAPAAEAAEAPTGRLGLHITTAELTEWRARAVSGPYRVGGDVAENSPGDWARIESGRNAFVASPTANRWAGPAASTGCVAGSGSTANDPKPANSRYLRDAAFHALVVRDATVRRTAARELYAQSQVAGLDFSDRGRWCLETIWDLNPGFEIANFLTSLLYAFEYVEIGDREAGTSSLTDAEERALLDWMYAAAEWMNHDNNVALAKNFTDRDQRSAPPYTLTAHRSSNPVYSYAPYDGTGDVIGAIARYYNNRRAQQQRFVGLLGLHLLHRGDGYRPAGTSGQTVEDLVADSGKFARDYLVYSVYPDGFSGEFQRWSSTLPDLGWGYAIAAAAPVLTYVDASGRAGDTTLFEYVTTAGAHNTAGAPTGQGGKNFRWLVSQLMRYQDGSYERYIPGQAGVAAARIDGFNAASGWDAVHEVAFSPAMRYWQDSFQIGVVERTGAGTRPYPSRPAGFGQYTAWSGDWGTLPAALFMFGHTGDLPSPYGSLDGTEPVLDTEPVLEPEPVQRGKSGKVKKAEELTAAACPTFTTDSTFLDVLGNAHEDAIACLASLEITQGLSATTYGPAASVSRGQMATFLVRVVEAAAGPLPAASRSHFTDTAGSPHAASIDRLAEAGLVAGTAPGAFSPEAPVSRGQMAAFVVRVAEHLGLPVNPMAPDAFTDDDGSTHEAAIDVAADLAIVTGDAAGDFHPTATVRRDQMASFLTRLVGSLTLAGSFPAA